MSGGALRFGLCPMPIADHRWNAVWEMLLPAIDLAPDGEDWDDLRDDLATGHRQLWLCRDEAGELVSATVTACDEGEMEIELHAGSLASLCFLAVIEGYALAGGLVTVTASGRRGWARALRRYGYELTGGPRYEVRKALA